MYQADKRPKSGIVGANKCVRSKRNFHDLFVQATLARNRGDKFDMIDAVDEQEKTHQEKLTNR